MEKPDRHQRRALWTRQGRMMELLQVQQQVQKAVDVGWVSSPQNVRLRWVGNPLAKFVGKVWRSTPQEQIMIRSANTNEFQAYFLKIMKWWEKTNICSSSIATQLHPSRADLWQTWRVHELEDISPTNNTPLWDHSPWKRNPTYLQAETTT